MCKEKVILFLSSLLFFTYSFSISAKAICVGIDCSIFPQSTILGLNAIDFLLPELITNNLLNGMAESAVLNNINSSMPSTRNLYKPEIGLGYSMTKTNLNDRNILFQNTELNQLPRYGAAISPALQYGNNLSNIFGSSNSSLSKWNLNFHFFPYTFNELQIPFANIKNTNVNGKVFNSGLNFRYFPTIPKWNLFGSGIYIDGISFGFGLFHTYQNAHLNSYDRRPFPLNISSESRKWMGMNDLYYASDVYTSLVDTRGGIAWGRFFLYTGFGYTVNTVSSDLKLQRVAAIATSSTSNDFVTRPTLAILNIDEKFSRQYSVSFAAIGFEIKISNFKLQAEFLKNQNSESGNIGIKYSF